MIPYDHQTLRSQKGNRNAISKWIHLKEFLLISWNHDLELTQSQSACLLFSRISWRSHHTNSELILSASVAALLYRVWRLWTFAENAYLGNDQLPVLLWFLFYLGNLFHRWGSCRVYFPNVQINDVHSSPTSTASRSEGLFLTSTSLLLRSSLWRRFLQSFFLLNSKQSENYSKPARASSIFNSCFTREPRNYHSGFFEPPRKRKLIKIAWFEKSGCLRIKNYVRLKRETTLVRIIVRLKKSRVGGIDRTFMPGLLFRNWSNRSLYPSEHLGLCFGENRISSMILFLLLNTQTESKEHPCRGAYTVRDRFLDYSMTSCFVFISS